MISRIEGELLTVEGGRAELRCGPIVTELMVPASDTARLSQEVGEHLTFHTLLSFDAAGQGTSFVPRLIGFQSREARAFFELFTTVKGVGARKALRALELPFGHVAQAIAERDIALLTTLPEIGKRTAETIVAELHGKVDQFVELKPLGNDVVPDTRAALVREAAAVLSQLGESASNARQLIDRALAVDGELDTPDALVAAALRIKEG